MRYFKLRRLDTFKYSSHKSMPRFAHALVRAHRTLSRPLENAAEACTLFGKPFQSPDIHGRSVALEVFRKNSIEIKRNGTNSLNERYPKNPSRNRCPCRLPRPIETILCRAELAIRMIQKIRMRISLHVSFCLFFSISDRRRRQHGER